jgi:putative ABC transport system substrate-binding protein
MRRRQFLTLLGGLAAADPLAAHAQPSMPVIGFLSGQFPAGVARYVAVFRDGLKSAGFVEGQNVAIEFAYAEGRRDKLPAMAAEFVRRGVNVIVSTGGTPATVAAAAATKTIPVVFAIGSDPVGLGLVAGLNRPGGNATGSSFLFNALGAKRLEILHELVPAAKVIGYLVNPANPSIEAESSDMQAAAGALGLELRVQQASNEREIDAAFASFAEQRVQALITSADFLFLLQQNRLAALASRYALPASFHSHEIVAAGGLTSYGPSQEQAYFQAGVYTGRILKGEKPADLPVMQASKFDLIINLKTAKALGLTVPSKLLFTADEVIE